MSQVQPVIAATVRAAIARAAEATGVDFDYLLAQAQIESSLDPAAHAATSSAAGLYQFTTGTWLTTLERHGAEHGLPVPASRAEALALRFNPDVSALMAAELAGDNRAELHGVLGREPDAAELYLAHFLGAGGARQFLTAQAADPEQSAAALLPAAARSNRAIFYDHGSPRSLGEVMNVLRGKVALAMGQDDLPAIAYAPPPGNWGPDNGVQPSSQPLPEGQGFAPSGPLAVEFHSAARISMAETLRATFGASAAALPDSVARAYDRIRAIGL